MNDFLYKNKLILLFPRGQSLSCGPVSGDRDRFSLSLIWPCGSHQQDLDTALRSQQRVNKQQIQTLAPCRPFPHSLFLWATVQKRDRYKLKLIDEALSPSTAERLCAVMTEKQLKKKPPGLWTRWRVTTFTPPTATLLRAVGWLTWASCTASGGAVIARTCSKHRYMICHSRLLGWKFLFYNFPTLPTRESRWASHTSESVSVCQNDIWQLAPLVVCGVKTSRPHHSLLFAD